MGARILTPLYLLGAIFALAGCIYLPPSYTGSELHKSDDEIEKLLDNHATKQEVIKRLGTPLKYRESSLSYVACLDRARVVSDVREYRLKPECFELRLEFNESHYLTTYQKLPWSGEFDFNEEELMRRELARRGDPLAHRLWQQMVRNGFSDKQLDKMVQQGNDEIYLSMYWEDPGDTNALRWLCRAADKANPKAQYRLGLLYETGSENVPKDTVKAYLWYRLASSRGDYMMVSEQAERLHKTQTTEQVTRAEHLFQEWKPGQCEQELLHGQ